MEGILPFQEEEGEEEEEGILPCLVGEGEEDNLPFQEGEGEEDSFHDHDREEEEEDNRLFLEEGEGEDSLHGLGVEAGSRLCPGAEGEGDILPFQEEDEEGSLPFRALEVDMGGPYPEEEEDILHPVLGVEVEGRRRSQGQRPQPR